MADPMRCFHQGWHPEHSWIYGGIEMFCDGMTTTEPKPDGEPPRSRCCGDPLCPCATKPGWTTHEAGSMNYPDLNDPEAERSHEREA